ncbi:hypothetical protein C1646_712609 [Rhizophagus diaphanus]|nr:hypothetical protein C1646_712609 [Rhizophagus diaphanus] [Rhizophagus sp. MUCL 43196]
MSIMHSKKNGIKILPVNVYKGIILGDMHNITVIGCGQSSPYNYKFYWLFFCNKKFILLEITILDSF